MDFNRQVFSVCSRPIRTSWRQMKSVTSRSASICVLVAAHTTHTQDIWPHLELREIKTATACRVTTGKIAFFDDIEGVKSVIEVCCWSAGHPADGC